MQTSTTDERKQRVVPVMKTQSPEKSQSPSRNPRSAHLLPEQQADTTVTNTTGSPNQEINNLDVRPPEDLERCFVFGYN